MLLHDTFFFSSNRSSNTSKSNLITIAHSPLFHSTVTLIISVFGACINLVCLLTLCIIISRYQRRKSQRNKVNPQATSHILAHRKYRFLIFLTSNDFLLCLASIISCLDEKFYLQSLVARYHLCSLHILMWKFTLHFIPLFTISILLRYHYLLNKKFPVKYFNTTTFNQLFCTDLCALIPFVIAIAWSVDGLWLWGETNVKNFVAPSTNFAHEGNQSSDMVSTAGMNKNLDQSDVKLEEYYRKKFYALKQQQIICYFQTNNNLEFTARLLHLIQADFLLLFSLHFVGLCLGILLHIRLSCCLIARKITSSFLREQQISLYILYIFAFSTVTSFPFYFYRSIEIVFDSTLLPHHYDLINSRTLAQTILCGVSFKPVLYFLLLVPSKILFKFKCYTSIQIEAIDRIDDVSYVVEVERQPVKRRLQGTGYSLKLSSFYPKLHMRLRALSDPVISTDHHHYSITSNVTHV